MRLSTPLQPSTWAPSTVPSSGAKSTLMNMGELPG